jgi:hypothetical protein
MSINREELLKPFGTVEVKKTSTKVTGKDKKVAYVTNRRISLQDYKPEYGTNVRQLTEEKMKKAHLGNVKCVMKFKTDEELKDILTKYFA